MIIGFAKNDDAENLKVDEVAKGLFVVRDAYAGDYDFFDSGEELFSNETETVKVAETTEVATKETQLETE